MEGIFTALATPFTTEDQIDLQSFKNLLELQKNAKVHGVVPCGTTGESPTLTLEEKKELIRTCLKELQGTGIKVIAGTGSNSTQDTIEFSKWASSEGVDGILVVTPYYNKPTQEGLKKHFLSVAEQVNCEVMPYNVPGRTAVCMSPETICDLAQHPKITSLKEATADLTFMGQVVSQLSKNHQKLSLLSGDDPTFLPFLAAGGNGIVSVASNIIPDVLVKIYHEWNEGNFNVAQKTFNEYFELFKNLFIESNPIPVKYALEKKGICSQRVRLPLTPLAQKSQLVLDQILSQTNLKTGK